MSEIEKDLERLTKNLHEARDAEREIDRLTKEIHLLMDSCGKGE